MIPWSHPIVPHGMGGTVLGTPMCPTLHGSVPPSHHPTWDGWDCPRDSHMSRHTPCVRPVPLSHMGQEGLSWGHPYVPSYVACATCPSRPIVPHGMGGTVLGTPMCPTLHGSVPPSHRPTWDGWDCPRDSHVSHPTWLCPTCPSRPIVPHGTGGTVLGIPMCPVIHGLSHVSIPSHCPM